MVLLSITTACALAFYSFVVLLPSVSSFENGFEPQDFQIGHIFFWSADAPLSKALSNFRLVVDTTDLLLKHIQNVEDAIIASISTGKAPTDDDSVRPCNNIRPKFGKGATNKMGFRGWPAPDVTCLSDIYGTDITPGNLPQEKIDQYSVDDLYDALFRRGQVISNNIKSIAKSVIDEKGNFTDPDLIWNYLYETPSQRCVLQPAGAYRIGDKWYLAHTVTNSPKLAQRPLLQRQLISEYSRVVDGKLDPKLMCLPERPKTGEKHEFRTDATSVITSYRGIAGPWFVSGIDIEENPAILRSLDDSDLSVQQAADAVTASNVAILVLPLGLNLVPIALLADVGTLTMLLYTLMSDILTVVPLGIKGAELIKIGSQRHRTVMVRMSSANNGSRSESAAASLFAAECRAHDNVLPTGIAFLVLAIVFLVGGIAAEFIARSYVLKRRENRLKELEDAAFVLSSRGSSERASAATKESASFASKGAFEPASFASFDIQQRSAVGSPFRNGSFNDTYDEKRRDKKE